MNIRQRLNPSQKEEPSRITDDDPNNNISTTSKKNRRSPLSSFQLNLVLSVIVFIVLLTTSKHSPIASTILSTFSYAHDGVDEDKVYDAVIVGAGWSGLRAAKTLLNAGITNILILEANDYIGGRSKSINQDDSINSHPHSLSRDNVPIELGSEWLFTENSMDRYLTSHGYIDGADIIDPRAYHVPLEGAQFYEQKLKGNGTSPTLELETSIVPNSEQLRERVWKRFMPFRRERLKKLSKNGEDETYADAMEAFEKQYELSPLESKYLWLLGEMFSIEYNGDVDEISLEERDIFSGGSAIPDSKYMGTRAIGYGNLARRYGESFLDKVRLNSKVTHIANYNGENDDYEKRHKDYVVITYDNHDQAGIQVAAKTVLMTASLGVLKSNTINFTPHLPGWKTDAIANMGFGTLNKCAMYWHNLDDMVWPKDIYWFELLKDDKETSGKWTSFYNPTKMKGTPTMIAWVGGQDARDVESQSNEEILREVLVNLRAMFPTVSDPDKVHISRWNSEPNVKGTYSYKSVGRDFGIDSATLGRPIGKLWFAGEATAGVDWYASTVGAWRTGDKAAENMIRTIKGRKKKLRGSHHKHTSKH